MPTRGDLTVGVNKVDALIDKHRNIVFCQLLMPQLRAVGVRLVFDHNAPDFRFPRRVHDEVARVRRTIDEDCWALFNQQILR